MSDQEQKIVQRQFAEEAIIGHLILWPEGDEDLSRFMQRLTITHVTRWQRHKRRVGYGHLYRGRYKYFPVETDEYF